MNIAVLDEHYKSIYHATRGIVFIGTPHRGTESLASFLSKALAMTFSSTGKKFVADLSPGSSAITEITRDFKTHTQDMHFVSFYESRGMQFAGVRQLLFVQTNNLDHRHSKLCGDGSPQ
jgi:hypothetical protein